MLGSQFCLQTLYYQDKTKPHGLNTICAALKLSFLLTARLVDRDTNLLKEDMNVKQRCAVITSDHML